MNSKIITYIAGGAVLMSLVVAGVSFAATATQTTADSIVSSSTPRTLPGDVKPPAAIAPWCEDYGENLGVGSRGDDVLALQKELALDGESVPATGYFGKLTAAAVTAFQEKNASDVLVPRGLSRGTGYFGSSTRAKLNSVGESHCVIPNSSGNSSSTQATQSFSASPQSGSAPLTVQFVATAPQGGTLGNAVDFGDGTKGNLGVVPVCSSCNAEGMVSHTYVATGTYTATLTSGGCSCPANGVCNCPNIPILATTTVVVGSAGTSTTSSLNTPVILGIAPTSSPVGGLVTITGTGFAATDTVLIDGMVGGGTEATSSDGTAISFIVPGSLRPNCTAHMMCAMYILLLQPGNHAVSVMANGLTSNTTTLAVINGSSSIAVQ
jgi:peptidoglycan hydrolase-like protein with peptidoglycan-binding domain